MGCRVNAALIRDVVKALDELEKLREPTIDSSVELSIDKPVLFYSDNARREHLFRFSIIPRFNEGLDTTYFEVVL